MAGWLDRALERLRGEARPPLVDLAIAGAWAILVRIVLVGPVQPASYWDTGSYLGQMAKIARSGPFPAPSMRPPGYPLMLLVTSWNGRWLHGTVLAQQALGIAAVCLVYLLIVALGASRWVALLGAAAYSVMPDVLFMEVTLYSETLALFLLALAGYLLVLVLKAERGGARPGALLGAVVAAGALTRPILQTVAPLLAGALLAAAVSSRRRSGTVFPTEPAPGRRPWRCAGAYTLTVAALLGGAIVINGLRFGSFRLASGAGFSSLNYLGHPAMHRDLPADLAWISGIYRGLDGRQPRWQPYVPWRLALPPILRARKRLGLSAGNWDRAALDTTWRVVRARPLVYVSLWSRTLFRYWTRFHVLFGPWRTERDAGSMDRLQVTPFRWRMVCSLSRFWSTWQPVVSLLFLLALPLALLDRSRPPAVRSSILWLWAVVAVLSLASTALEPALGQARYRMPSSPLIVALAVTAVSSAFRLTADRWRAGRAVNPDRR